jgi:hypothetical protein
MSPQELVFLDHVKKQCKLHGIKLELRKRSSYLKLGGSIRCSGYFDSENKLLVVATKKIEWLDILVHEYAHLTQFVDQCDAWVGAAKTADEIDRWLRGEEVENIESHIVACRQLELDNEKRSVEIIKIFNLPLDLERYVKKANAYVYFYTWMMKTRKWSKPGNSPYSNETLIDAMPNEFQDNYEVLPDYIAKVFEEQGI